MATEEGNFIGIIWVLKITGHLLQYRGRSLRGEEYCLICVALFLGGYLKHFLQSVNSKFSG
jgi:hypothetical protein